MEREKQNINAMLGSMDGAEYVGPRAPTLPPIIRSMGAREFTLGALASFGARVTPHGADIYLSEQDGGREFIRFEESTADGTPRATLYVPGSAAFSRLVDKTAATGVHIVDDTDGDVRKDAATIAGGWATECGATTVGTEVKEVRRNFEGTALVRVRATVAHDSYERLVEVPCDTSEHNAWSGRKGLAPLPDIIQDAAALGSILNTCPKRLAGMPQFRSSAASIWSDGRRKCRQRTAMHARKKKLEDDFTPRLEMELVGLQGAMNRHLKLSVRYKWDDSPEYASTLTVKPSGGTVLEAPPLGVCAQTGQTVPQDCLQRCEMTGMDVLRHRLVRSDMSGRFALPEHTFVCNLSKQRILLDEAELSDATGQVVARSFLRSSAISGKRAEPEHLGQCEFTQADALLAELEVSDVSGKRYRLDEQMRSAVSGRAGHRREFILCYQTQEPIVPDEAERCAVSGMPFGPASWKSAR